MNPSTIDRIAEAVLYEGYILYPYRASSRKNRQRFTFGRVYPQAYGEAQNGAEPFTIQTECLLRSRGERPTLEVRVRFLHPLARGVGLLAEPVPELPADIGTSSFSIVPELRVDTSFIRLGKKRLNGKSDRIIDFWIAVLTRRGRSLFIFPAPWRSIRFAMVRTR